MPPVPKYDPVSRDAKRIVYRQRDGMGLDRAFNGINGTGQDRRIMSSKTGRDKTGLCHLKRDGTRRDYVI